MSPALARDVGVVLAAGGSTRLGRSKALVELAGGTLLARALGAMEGVVDRRVVVLGQECRAGREEVRSHAELADVSIVENEHWREGLGSSISVGVSRAMEMSSTGILLTLVDQVLVSGAHLAELVARGRSTGRAVGTRYAGVVGVPAWFPASYATALVVLHADQGARALLRDGRCEAIEFEDAGVDVDTPEDLARVRARLTGEG